MKWPAPFVYGFLAAEGHHCIQVPQSGRGHVQLGCTNKDRRLLEIVRGCLIAIGFESSINGPNVNGGYQLNIHGTNLEKAQFAVQSPWPNKRAPSNYLVRRDQLGPDVQAMYDQALHELYEQYGEERVNEELMPAKRTEKKKRKEVSVE